jgi:hypothetical protein
VEPVIHREALDMAFGGSREAPAPDSLDPALAAVNLTRRHYEMFVADTARVLETLGNQFKEH